MYKTPDRARLLTVAEVAEMLHMSERTVKRRIAEGELAALKFGRRWRIARSDLESFLARHHQGAGRGIL